MGLPLLSSSGQGISTTTTAQVHHRSSLEDLQSWQQGHTCLGCDPREDPQWEMSQTNKSMFCVQSSTEGLKDRAQSWGF